MSPATTRRLAGLVMAETSMSDLARVVSSMFANPHCLWIGAGVAKYLARSGDSDIPLWSEFTQQLETQAKLSPPPGLSYAQRLEACHRELGFKQFQREVRGRVHRSLCLAVSHLADLCVGHESAKDPLAFIPYPVQLMARLGCSASPLVSFNVESLTSVLVAGLGKSFALRPYVPPLPQYPNRWHSSGSHRAGEPARIIYHPHGLINMSGLCVLTAADYRSQEATLAFQLAIHAAFQSDLYIVGMSLEDAYLREHLAAFRSQIKRIYWFTDRDVTKEESLTRWCWTTRLDVVRVCPDWSDFWEAIAMHAPAIDASNVRTLGSRWSVVSEEAYDELVWGGRHVSQRNNFGDPELDSAIGEHNRFFAEIYGEQASSAEDPGPASKNRDRFRYAMLGWLGRKDHQR